MGNKTDKVQHWLSFALSLLIVGFGQPARSTILGVVAAGCGYALFFTCLRKGQKSTYRFFTGALWYFFVQMIQLSWMTSIEFQGYYILWVYAGVCFLLSLQWGALTLLIPREGEVPLYRMLSIASAWTLMEWLRLLPLCGFTWSPAGMALSSSSLSMQFASVFGVLGLSFWVIFTNMACLNAHRSHWKWSRALSFLAIAALPYLYGMLHLRQATQPASHPKIHVALVQTHMLPSHKIPYPDRMEDYIPAMQQWQSLVTALKEEEKDPWDLIVFPEGAVRYPSDFCVYILKDILFYLTELYGQEVYQLLPPLKTPYAQLCYAEGRLQWCASNLFWCQTLANIYQAEIVIGLDTFDRTTEQNFNSAFHFLPNQLKFERYDKQVLLPLAEYLPFEPLRALAARYGIAHFFSRGNRSVVFNGKLSLSPSICYEETFSEAIRKSGQNGVDLFVNLTNDNYFPRTSLHRQHFFHSRLRAVENGTPLMRACNTGVSGVVDCFGKSVAILKQGEQIGKSTVLSAEVDTHSCPTLFTLWGELGILALSLSFCLVEGYARFLGFSKRTSSKKLTCLEQTEIVQKSKIES